jgi:hypothetical protein
MGRKKCNRDGCAKRSQKWGVCVAHGAKKIRCSHEGCTNGSQKGGVCVAHGAKRKRCSNEGCANRARQGGVCITHGARVKRCSHEGCTNRSQKGGVCVTHGATKKLCSQEGCAKQAQKGGLCLMHGAYSIASVSQNGEARPPHPAGGDDATAVVATAIAGVGGGENEFVTHNLQADVRCASSPASPCLRPFIMAPNFSDDELEIIGAWIWRSSSMARLGSVNNSDGSL